MIHVVLAFMVGIKIKQLNITSDSNIVDLKNEIENSDLEDNVITPRHE